MPRSSLPRKPIPKFKKADLDIANLCAEALWYGINFETGKAQISDANLLSRFAPYFYEYHKTKKKPNPNIFLQDVRDLILACGIKMLFRGIAGMNFRKGINAIYTDVYPIFQNSLKKPGYTSSHIDAIRCLEVLSKGFVTNPKENRLNMASRILFFLSPNLQTFNMNNKIAVAFGLPTRPHYHYSDYFELFAKGLVTNQTGLSKFKMPSMRDDLDYQTWYHISKTDWWKRRVLDIAVLLIASPTIAPHPNLKKIIKEVIAQDQFTLN
jgi:hypothetical protein